MKVVKSVWVTAFLLWSFDAFAGVVKVDDYKGDMNLTYPVSSGPQISIPCEYEYTDTNCLAPKVLGGRNCVQDGVTYYETCQCPSDWQVCTPPRNSVAAGAVACEENGEMKYADCLCNFSTYSHDSSNCAILNGESCIDSLGEHWNGCDSFNCNGYDYVCTDETGRHGGGVLCNGRYNRCECDSNYSWDASNCQDPQVLSGNVCHAINPNIEKWTGCTCPTEYNRSCQNVCPDPEHPGYYLAPDVCGRLGSCPGNSGNYAHCGTDVIACSAGKTLYRLNNSSDNNWISPQNVNYPVFVCSNSTEDTISLYCNETSCIEEVKSRVNGSGTLTVPSDDYTYEKAGIMLNDNIAVAIDRDPKSTPSDSLIKTYLSRWIGYSNGDHGSLANSTIGGGTFLTISYNNNTLCYGSEDCSGVTSVLHGLSSGVGSTASALSGTTTTLSSPRGPIDTYNYTFGVPYYDDNNSQIVSSGMVRSDSQYYLGTIYNGTAGYGKGIVAPAWYCMRKNLELMGSDAFSVADNNASSETVVRNFAAGKKVYYYLPTAGDWQVFNGYASSHAGFVDNTLIFGENNPIVSMWSSTLNEVNNTPMVYRNDLRYRSISAANAEQDGSNNDGPCGTMCFIYVPGWTPSGACSVTMSGLTVTLQGSGCTAQSNN